MTKEAEKKEVKMVVKKTNNITINYDDLVKDILKIKKDLNNLSSCPQSLEINK